MYGWSFQARTPETFTRLVRAMGRHRYLHEVDLRVHFCVDRALAEHLPSAAAAAARFEPEGLELGSRDPRLWRAADAEEVSAMLELFWGAAEPSADARARLSSALREAGIPKAGHRPFASDPDEAPHPELVLLDWTLVSVDQLDTERHAGALRAMAKAEEDVSASAWIDVEGPSLAEPELCEKLPAAGLPDDPIFWADGPYSYCDYLFRGVAKASKLGGPPLGYEG